MKSLISFSLRTTRACGTTGYLSRCAFFTTTISLSKHRSYATWQDEDDEDRLVDVLIQDADREDRHTITEKETVNVAELSAENKLSTSGKGLQRDEVEFRLHDATPTFSTAPKTLSPAFPLRSEAENEKVSTGFSGGTVSHAAAVPTEVTPSRAVNKAYEPYARVRNTMRLSESGQKEFVVEWMCVHCLTFNYVGRAACRRCNAPCTASYRGARPPARQVSVFPSVWLCEACGHKTDAAKSKEEKTTTESEQSRRSKFFCHACKTPFAGLRDWYCAACSHLNPRAAVQCATCFTERPPHWTCSACQSARNSIFGTTCIDCHHTRPQKRSDSVLHCPNCDALNDVRWEICSSCVRPLPMMQESEGHSATPLYTAGPPALRTAVLRELSPKVNDASTPDASVPASNRAKAAAAETVDTTGKPSSKDAAVAASSATTSSYVHPRASSTVAPPAFMPGSEVEGSWWCCRCNVLLRRNASFCDICLRPRQVAQLPDTATDNRGAASALPTHLEPRPGDWLCPYCRQFQSVKTRSCCSHERQVPQGYWLCPTCCSTNRRDRATCLGCGAAPHFKTWTCSICNRKNTSSDETCVVCAVPRVHFWTCPQCGEPEYFTEESCSACGTARPSSAHRIIICDVCHAANGVTRTTCFRCRERLCDDQWECLGCGTQNEREALRCTTCQVPRPYDFTEISWVCKVCSNVMAHSARTGEFTRCTLCMTERQPDCFTFPTRWRCVRCGAGNLAFQELCQSCASTNGGSSPRVMAGLQAHVTCTHCFRDTVLNEEEKCQHCHSSLTELFTEMTRSVSLTVSSDVMITDLGRQAQELLAAPEYLP